MAKRMIYGIRGHVGEKLLNDLHSLARAEGLPLRVFSLMEPVKKGVMRLFNLNREQLLPYSDLRREVLPHLGKTPNELMYLVENVFGRQWLHDSVWVDAMERTLGRYSNDKPFIAVVSGLRTEEDCRWVTDKDGLLFDGCPLFAPEKALGVSEDVGKWGYLPESFGGMTVFGAAGYAKTGKDTMVDHFVMHHDFVKIAFATPFKEALGFMFDLTEEHLYGSLKDITMPEFGKSPREMMQMLGTDLCRAFVRDDIWHIMVAENVMLLNAQGYAKVGISDVRNDHEAGLVRDVFRGTMWHVRKSGSKPVNGHVIEKGVTIFDGDKVVDNDGTLDDFYQAIETEFQAMDDSGPKRFP